MSASYSVSSRARMPFSYFLRLLPVPKGEQRSINLLRTFCLFMSSSGISFRMSLKPSSLFPERVSTSTLADKPRRLESGTATTVIFSIKGFISGSLTFSSRKGLHPRIPPQQGIGHAIINTEFSFQSGFGRLFSGNGHRRLGRMNRDGFYIRKLSGCLSGPYSTPLQSPNGCRDRRHDISGPVYSSPRFGPVKPRPFGFPSL